MKYIFYFNLTYYITNYFLNILDIKEKIFNKINSLYVLWSIIASYCVINYVNCLYLTKKNIFS
ncbi:LOW QUALITY PROTEIN: hypothetical protein HZS_3814 [Henneguya salminicola]|nr:LOW QUALITY PROTEIN: hypothetical protein HZS_3814 [Henneguya salminicola]